MPIACRAADARGQLKHTFLDNTILSLNEELLRLHLRENPTFVGSMDAIAEELTESLVADYNPAGLVDRLSPLTTLSETERGRLRDALGQRYVKVFSPADRRHRLAAAWQSLHSALRRWELCDPEEPSAEAFASLQRRAQEYRAELSHLPQGVWLE